MIKNIYTLVALTLTVLCYSAGKADAGTLGDAWGDVKYLDFRRAAPQFEKIYKESKPDSDKWREAMLGLALCLQERQPDTKADKERADKLYDKLIASSNGKSIQATALLLRGKSYQLIDYYGDHENFEKAAECYQRILIDWPQSGCADEAALYLAQISVFSMDRDKALAGIKKLEGRLAVHPKSQNASVGWLLVALTQRMPLENYGDAVNAYLKALQAGLPEDVEVDVIYWRIASMAQLAGKKKIARDFYTRIIVEVPRSSYTYMAQQKIIAMGYDAPELVNPFESIAK